MATEKPYNAGDPEQVEERKADARRGKTVEKDAYIGIMQSKDGRKWMYDLLDMCHIYREPYIAETNYMYFCAGQKNVGQKLLGDLQGYCPEYYLTMIKESKDG